MLPKIRKYSSRIKSVYRNQRTTVNKIFVLVMRLHEVMLVDLNFKHLKL